VGLELNGTHFSAIGFDFTPRENTIAIIQSQGDVGESESITVCANGLPVISYHDITNDALKAVHCAKEFCVPFVRRQSGGLKLAHRSGRSAILRDALLVSVKSTRRSI
jgi:hypothetical protein